MRKTLAALGLAVLMTGGAAHAMPCDGIDLELREAVQEVLTDAEVPQVAGIARYLNDAFYTDLGCKLYPDMTAADVLRLKGEPNVLIDLVIGTMSDRNQSDALMLMLSAMKDAAGTES